MVTVHASQHPFREEWVEAEVEPGQTINEITGNADVIVWANGYLVPENLFDTVRIKEDAELVIWPVPQDSDILRSVALIAVAAAATFVAGGASGLIASKATPFTQIAGAAVGLAGSLLVNTLIPPPVPQGQESSGGFNRLQAITGVQNQVGAFQPIPRLYGDMRFFPAIPMTGKPFTEISGNDQYLRMLLVLGYGPLDIGGVEVGEGRNKAFSEQTDTNRNIGRSTWWNSGTFNGTKIDDNDNVILEDDPNFSDRFVDSGTWISPGLDFSALGGYKKSSISWSVLGNGTHFVDVSIDNGSTWTRIQEGDPIPGLSKGDDLSNVTVFIRVTLEPGEKLQTYTSFTTTPALSLIDVQVEGLKTPSFNSSFAPVKIGETPIEDFDGVEYEIGTPDQMSIYTDQVVEEEVGWTTSSTVSGGWVDDGGVSATRTTESGTTEISLDMEGRLFSVQDDGDTKKTYVEFKVEYRKAGTTNAWIPVVDNELTDNEGVWRPRNGKRETFRQGLRWSVPKGQWEVRITRLRTNFRGTAAASSELTWTVLRSIKEDKKAWTVPNTVVMDLRIKATDQLNSRLDNLSVRATSVLPVWDGSQWVEQSTRTPAWIFADILTGTTNRRPLSKSSLDKQALLNWANQTDNDDDFFDFVMDDSGTVLDRIRDVTTVGRASWSVQSDTTVSVVRDIPQNSPKMVISPRNSSGFTYQMSAVEIPDALRVQFIDPDTWENTERLVFDDGFDETNAQVYETLQAPGIRNAEQAWRFGRYHIAQQRLRPERYSFTQDVQYLRYGRGDLLTLQHDVIRVGLAAARIKSVEVGNGKTKVNLDEFMPMDDPNEDYAIVLQKSDGSILSAGVLNQSPGKESVTWEFESPEVEPDDHLVFGIKDIETIDVKVTSIQPQGDLKASVDCVPAAPNILDALNGTIPSFDPQINEPTNPDQLPLPVPVIRDVQSGTDVQLNNTDGQKRLRMVVSALAPNHSGFGTLQYQIRYRPVGDSSWTRLGFSEENSQSIPWIDRGTTYEIEVRSGKNGKVSNWSTTTKHTIPGFVAPNPGIRLKQLFNEPPSPSGNNSTIEVEINKPNPIQNYSHSEIYYKVQGDKGWNFLVATNEVDQVLIGPFQSDGKIIEVQARPVSNDGVVATDGIVDSITIYNVEEDNEDPPSEKEEYEVPPPIRLELVDDFGEGVYTGRDPVFTWDPPANDSWYDIGKEPTAQGAGAGGTDQFLARYEVEIVVGNEIVGRYFTKQEQFEYTFERNTQDNGGTPQRAFTIRVWSISQQNVRSKRPAFISVNNPTPTIDDFTIESSGFTTLKLGYTEPEDLDWRGTKMYVSDTSGFTPSASTLVHQGPDTTVIVEGLQTNATYYVKYIPRDAFGDGSVSGELSASTRQLTANKVDDLGPWATRVTDVDETFINDTLQGDAVPSTKIKNLTAAKLTAGVVNVTLDLTSQGTVTADNGTYITTMGAHQLDTDGDGTKENTVYLHSAFDPDTHDLRWAVRESGVMEAVAAEIEGSITISGGTGVANLSDSGSLAEKNQADSADISFNFADSNTKGGNAIDTDNVNGTSASTVEGGAQRANSGLNSSGDVSRTIRGVNLPSTGNEVDGLNMNSDRMGYWDSNASEWRSYIDSNGNFFFGDPSGGEDRVAWDAGVGTLNVVGFIRTSDTSERFELDSADNTAKFFDSSGNQQIAMGPPGPANPYFMDVGISNISGSNVALRATANTSDAIRANSDHDAAGTITSKNFSSIGFGFESSNGGGALVADGASFRVGPSDLGSNQVGLSATSNQAFTVLNSTAEYPITPKGFGSTSGTLDAGTQDIIAMDDYSFAPIPTADFTLDWQVPGGSSTNPTFAIRNDTSTNGISYIVEWDHMEF